MTTKLEYSDGKHWWSTRHQFDCEAPEMKRETDADGWVSFTMTATPIPGSFVDLTDYSPLARFLRWAERRYRRITASLVSVGKKAGR